MNIVRNKLSEFMISIVALFGFVYYIYYILFHTPNLLNEMLKGILSPMKLIYQGQYFKTYTVFPEFLDLYNYSMSILVSSFCIGLLFSTLITYIYYISAKKLQKWISIILIFLESIPDIMFLVLTQVFVISVFKMTDSLIIEIFTFGSEKIYVLPILILSIVPIIHITKMMVIGLEEEVGKPYIEFAIAKGLSPFHVFFHHLLRNIIFHLLNHSKTIILFMFSSLFVIEALCNIRGFTTLITQALYLPAPAFYIALLMLYVPFFLLFTGLEIFVVKKTGGGEE